MDQLPRHFPIRSSVQSIPILISRIVLPWNTVTSVTTSVTIALIGMLLDIYDRSGGGGIRTTRDSVNFLR